MRRFVEIKFVVIVKAYRKAYRNNRSSFAAGSNSQNRMLVNVVHTQQYLARSNVNKRPLVVVLVRSIIQNLQCYAAAAGVYFQGRQAHSR